MELMKTKKNKILSVLQTFVHDPLLEWKNSNETGENQAISAIMEVKRRLSCLSEDRSTIQSPKSVVDQLIEEEKSKQIFDPENQEDFQNFIQAWNEQHQFDEMAVSEQYQYYFEQTFKI